MDSKTLIYKLIYQTFLDIRTASYEGKGINGIFKLADLFHNVPLRLSKISDDKDYEDLLADLKEKAKLKGCDSWLDSAITQFTGKTN